MQQKLILHVTKSDRKKIQNGLDISCLLYNNNNYLINITKMLDCSEICVSLDIVNTMNISCHIVNMIINFLYDKSFSTVFINFISFTNT